MNKHRTIELTTVAVAALFFLLPAGYAHEDAEGGDLLERLEALEQRLSALEAARSFASFMPDLAERFHVMHRAGDAGDWAVAAHELAEIQKLTRQSTSIDEERGTLMQSMLNPSLEKIESAIEHGNTKKFSTALENTISVCNSCHRATGAQFVQVTLHAPDGLSMRHPHRLMTRDAPEGHHHGSQSGHRTQRDSDKAHGHAPRTPEDHGHGGPAGDSTGQN